MSTTTQSTKKTTNRNGARPAYIVLGVDARGAHHIYDTRTETVHIVHKGGARERRELGDHDVDDWMDAVDGSWGWDVERYGQGLVEMLDEQMDVA
jgi:hypothetical protein